MTTRRIVLIALSKTLFGVFLAVGLLAPAAFSAEPLHVQIDRLVAARTPSYATLAAPLASDAEFLRRVTLDLNGTTPTATQVREFLADADPEKRVRLVDRLLESPAYARQMQRQFDVLFMQRRASKYVPVADWQTFLRQSFAENKPYDRLVREIVSSDGSDPKLRPASRFYLDRDGEQHEITRDIGRIFLGVNLECAQCHDHPHVEDYKQQHYYGIAAFFNRSALFRKGNEVALAEKADGEVSFESVFEIRDKKSTGPKSTPPRLFDAAPVAEPVFDKGHEYRVKPAKDVRSVPRFSRRALLANSMTDAGNVRFRRTVANRLWKLMLGRGLIEPAEYDHSENPPSHPELLNLLADDLVERRFEIRGFLREIALTQTYQRSSYRAPDAPAIEEGMFGQALLKPLTPEQLAWAMLQATGVTDAEREALGKAASDETLFARLGSVENQFVALFGSEPGKIKQEFEASVQQALFLANDPTAQAWLAPRPGNLIDRLTKLPADNPTGVADELFVSVLCRPPTPEEIQDITQYLSSRVNDRLPALQELAWALLTSAEFRFNH